MVNTSKLKGKMKEKNKTQEDLAKVLNMSVKTTNVRLKKGIFKTNEIDIITHFLHLTREETVDIFFAHQVSQEETKPYK